MHDAECDDANHNHQDHSEEQRQATPPRPRETPEAGEEARTDRVSFIRAVRRLRLAHYPPSSTASSLERVITHSAERAVTPDLARRWEALGTILETFEGFGDT